MVDHKTRQTARIVDATLQLLHQNGFSALSISRVAAAAGVTRQTIYNYFPDVQSILVQAMEAHSEALEIHLISLFNNEKRAFSKLKVFAQFQIMHADPEYGAIALETGLSKEVRDRIALHMERVKAALAQAIFAGVETDDFHQTSSHDVVVEFVWGLVEGAVKAATKYPDEKEKLVEATCMAMKAILHHGMSPTSLFTSVDAATTPGNTPNESSKIDSLYPDKS
ncbi:MAG: TetR/AcrR family transcriptional regulator [Deltaproteobacteria bacterium]|nr:TetR/AcrR family transcriptional regulator [Deltaproteobacteria bacterium]